MSIEQYKQLKLHEKQDQVQRLCKAFIKDFFQYTRDNGWMQEAVGEDVSWVDIDGISDWHIKAALHSLQGAQDNKGLISICSETLVADGYRLVRTTLLIEPDIPSPAK